MALGRRISERQGEFWVAAAELAGGSGHVFYDRLNDVLAEAGGGGGAGFDRFVEELCEPFYAASGRPSIPPGVYFRMLLVGYFEGIGSQRGIAWRCADSLSLRRFLGLSLTDKSPDHSSLTRIGDRLPGDVYNAVFTFVLDLVDAQSLLNGKAVGVDSTLLEANAAMKSIVRKETGENWNEYLTLAAAVIDVQVNLVKADCEAAIEEVAADKGYHANDQIAECDRLGLRTYIPEPESPRGRRWTDKSDDVKRAVLNNRRRTKRDKGRRLQRQRSEKVERSFAHLCNSGGTPQIQPTHRITTQPQILVFSTGCYGNMKLRNNATGSFPVTFRLLI